MRHVVAFDFDGTLTKKDSFLEFIRFSRGYFILNLNLPFIAVLWLLSKIGFISVHNAKQIVFSYFFKNKPLGEFNATCEAFGNHLDSILREDAKTTIIKHLQLKEDVCIISASIVNWIQPWAENNGIKTVLATTIQVDGKGRLTGKFSSPNCKGEEKVKRLLKTFPNRELYHLTVYGDSMGDKALMDIADAVFYKSLH